MADSDRSLLSSGVGTGRSGGFASFFALRLLASFQRTVKTSVCPEIAVGAGGSAPEQVDLLACFKR
jgi:hypothetical protein